MSRRPPMGVVLGICIVAVVGLSVVPAGVVAAGPVPVTTDDLAGSGTAGDPYVVTNASELQAINGSLGAHYTLGGDIDAAGTASWSGGAGFVPIGNATSPFTGSFDGSDYRIEALTITRSTAGSGASGEDAALFGTTDGATVSNLTLADATISAGDGGDGLDSDGTSGGAGGNASGLIAVAADTSITGVAVLDSTITAGTGGKGGDGYSGGSGGDGGVAGGLVAVPSSGSLSASLVDGATVVAGDGGAGGNSSGTNGGNGGDGGAGGGVIGHNSGLTVGNSSLTGISVTGGTGGSGGTGSTFDGVAGTHGGTGGGIGIHGDGTLRTVSAAGTVSGSGNVGGLVGTLSSPGTVRNASANVTTTGSNAGGLVGSGTTGTVRHSFATGAVTGTNTAGGLIGSTSSDLYFDDAYWDTETTGQANASASETNGNLVGLTTAEITGSGAVSNMSTLDFTETWLATDETPRHRWAVESVSLTLADTTLTEGETTSASVSLSLFDGSTVGATTTSTLTSDDTEVVTVSNSTVTAAGTGTAQLTATADKRTDSVSVTVEESETEGDDDSGGSSGGSSSGGGGDSGDSDSDDGTTSVTAVEAVGGGSRTDAPTEDSEEPTADESDTDRTVRLSRASASVRAGTTLEIALPPQAGADGTADEGSGETDDETGEAGDDGAEGEDGGTDDTAADPGETDADSGTGPNQPPSPPVSVAEVESVEIDVSEDADAEVEIRQGSSPPGDDASEFRRDDGTQVAGYVRITDNLDDEQVTAGRIGFRLRKDDLRTDTADPDNVAMYHYVPETDEWVELPTEIVGETDSHVRFRADTPGFSQFATGIKRAQFEISDTLVDVNEVVLGDSINVEAIVTNTGGADGTFTTQLLVDNEIVAEDALTIAAGGTRATIFDHQFMAADVYEVRVNDVSTGEITVTDPEAAAADSTDDFLPGFGFGTALVTLVVSALLYRRRVM